MSKMKVFINKVAPMLMSFALVVGFNDSIIFFGEPKLPKKLLEKKTTA